MYCRVCYWNVFVAMWNQFWYRNFKFWLRIFRTQCLLQQGCEDPWFSFFPPHPHPPEAQSGHLAKEFGKHWFQSITHERECSKNLRMWLQRVNDTGGFPSASLSLHTQQRQIILRLTLFRYQWPTSCGVMLLLMDSGWASSLLSLINQDLWDRLIFRNVGNNSVIYTLQTARRLEYFEASDSDLHAPKDTGAPHNAALLTLWRLTTTIVVVPHR